MVYIIAQYWVNNEPQSNEVLAGLASAMRMDFETKAQRITLLATGIYVANTIPAMFFGSFAGIGADRWPKIRVMFASNGLRALLVLFTPICLIPGQNWMGLSWGYWALITMTFFESLLTQFFAPAEQAAIPLLVPKEHLLAANSLYQATSMGATIIGFAIGEPLLRLLNNLFQSIGILGGEFFLLPFCYGIAAIFISSISLKENIHQLSKKNAWEEIVESIQIIKEKPKIKTSMIQLVLLYSLLAALYVLAITLASAITILGPTQFGVLLAISGLGMALAALAIAQFGHNFDRRKLAALGFSFLTFSLLLLGKFKGSLILTFIFCGVLGIGAALVAIPAQTTLQEETPDSQRGKVFGVQNNLTNIALSLPLVLAGTLVSKYGIQPVLLFLAAITLIAAFLERPWKNC